MNERRDTYVADLLAYISELKERLVDVINERDAALTCAAASAKRVEWVAKKCESQSRFWSDIGPKYGGQYGEGYALGMEHAAKYARGEWK